MWRANVRAFAHWSAGLWRRLEYSCSGAAWKFSITGSRLKAHFLSCHFPRASRKVRTVLLTQTHKQGGRASDSFSAKPVSATDLAIARSQDYLLGIQKPEGYWVGELMVD